MGANRIGIADSLDDRNFALVVQILDRGHGRVKPNLVIDGQNLVGFHLQLGPVVPVVGVVVGDDGVQGIVGARHLQNHQHWVFLIRGHGFLLFFGDWILRHSDRGMRLTARMV